MASPSLKSSSDSIGRTGSRIAAALSRKGSGIESADIATLTSIAAAAFPKNGSNNHYNYQEALKATAPTDNPSAMHKLKTRLKRKSQKIKTSELATVIIQSKSPELAEAIKIRAEIVSLRNKSADLRTEAAQIDRKIEEMEKKAFELMQPHEKVAEKINRIELLLQLDELNKKIEQVIIKKKPFHYHEILELEEIELRHAAINILKILKSEVDKEMQQEIKNTAKDHRRGMKMITSEENSYVHIIKIAEIELNELIKAYTREER